jgi:hypothetical protein
MADEIVIDAFHDELETAARARLKQAGEAWQTLDLGFYFGRTKNDEISIDLAVKRIMLRVLEEDQANLPNGVWGRLRERINANIVVSDAADILSEARDSEEGSQDV